MHLLKWKHLLITIGFATVGMKKEKERKKKRKIKKK